MANINAITLSETDERVQITKFDKLTPDQLIAKALGRFKDGDKLTLALVNRLMGLQSELDTYQEQIETDVEGAMAALH